MTTEKRKPRARVRSASGDCAMKTEAEIEEMRDKAAQEVIEWAKGNLPSPGVEGIRDALAWVLGDWEDDDDLM